VIWHIAVALWLAAAPPVRTLDVPVEAYQATAAARAVATVAGRVVVDGRRPVDDPVPVSDVAVTLVPRSERLLARFEEVRQRARATLDAYRGSAGSLRVARRELERGLADAGAGTLVRYTATAPDGTFELDGVPAGRWILIAERTTFVDKPGPEPGKKQRELYLPTPRMTGYYAVSVWLRELELSPGQATAVTLTDRGVWMTAIVEERAPGAGR
jgi:hypothetical protein